MKKFATILAAVLYQNKKAQDQFAQSDADWNNYYNTLNKRDAAVDNAWQTGGDVASAGERWTPPSPGARVAPDEPAIPPEMLTKRTPAPAPQNGMSSWPQMAAQTVGTGLKGMANTASHIGKSILSQPAPMVGGAAPKPPAPG